jgi:transcriptional regulator with XRE-family HTH domain
MAQGKAWEKDAVLKVLEPLFRLGMTRRKACMTAGVHESTLSRWETDDIELSIKIDTWIKEPSRLAMMNWVDKVKEGDYQASKDWLERKEKDEFSTKTENDITSKGEKLTDINIRFIDGMESNEGTRENS